MAMVQAFPTSAAPARWQDFVQLLKPRVMSLVVFTGLTGMICAERDAQDGGEAEHERRKVRRSEQAAQAGEDDQGHHARLGQREEIAPFGR
jgi:hypothetical protein